jgi:hypothetical protein
LRVVVDIPVQGDLYALSSLVVFAVLAAVAAPRVRFAQFQAPTDAELKMTDDPKAPGADAVYLYREETQDDDIIFVAFTNASRC